MSSVEKKVTLRVFPPTFKPVNLATNQLVESSLNTYLWLDKFRGSDAIHRSYVTCCKTSLLWVGKRATCTDFVAKVELLSTFWNNFSQPVTTWFVAIQVWTWVVKQAESLFNSFCRNVAKQDAFFLPIYLILVHRKIHKLQQQRRHRDANLVSL